MKGKSVSCCAADGFYARIELFEVESLILTRPFGKHFEANYQKSKHAEACYPDIG